MRSTKHRAEKSKSSPLATAAGCQAITLPWCRRIPTRRMHSCTESGNPWIPSCFQRISTWRSEEHTSELQSLMRISYAVFCLKKTNTNTATPPSKHHMKKIITISDLRVQNSTAKQLHKEEQ